MHQRLDEVEACVNRPCGTSELGIDKGYSEAFTDSDGECHGEGLGELLISQESDHLKDVYIAPQKITAIAKKTALVHESKQHADLKWIFKYQYVATY
ncbi:hypothetical protein CCP3SC5AM1_1200010 [Gammaproteobacteria bacterium]